MKNASPKISVVMSVFNNADYIDNAVQSILDQSFKDFEFIIFDDGSTDGSKEKLIRFGSSDTRIRLYLNESNKGLLKNLNNGLELATGEYIARMDGDDYSFPSRFQKQIDVLTTRDNVQLVGTGYYTIDRDGRRFNLTTPATDAWETAWVSLFGPAVMHPSAMFRASLISKEDCVYRDDMFPAEDFDMWSKIAKFGEIHIVSEPLIEYRVHGENISLTRRAAQLQKTSEIAERNIHDTFPELAVRDGQGIGSLTDFFYGNEKLEKSSIVDAKQALDAIFHQFCTNANLNSKQIFRLRTLTSRWIIKGAFRSDYPYASLYVFKDQWIFMLRELLNVAFRRMRSRTSFYKV